MLSLAIEFYLFNQPELVAKKIEFNPLLSQVCVYQSVIKPDPGSAVLSMKRPS